MESCNRERSFFVDGTGPSLNTARAGARITHRLNKLLGLRFGYSRRIGAYAPPLVNVVDKTFMKASATAAPNGRYALRETTLGTLIEAAYGVRDFQMRSRRWACRWRR